MPTVLKSVFTADTFFFHRKPRLKGCNNRKPLSGLKPQYRELKYKLPQNRTKNNAKPHHRKPLRPPLTSNAVIELLFYNFATESSADYVSVYDGDSTSSPLIGRFSGSSLPAPITSSSTKLYVRFTSDRSIQYRGFNARDRGIFIRIEDE